MRNAASLLPLLALTVAARALQDEICRILHREG